MAKRSIGVRESVGPTPTTPTIYSCDRCLRRPTIPFTAWCFESDGSEHRVPNHLLEQTGRVVVYIHDSCRVAQKAAGPVIASSTRHDKDDFTVVAGRQSYTANDVKIVTDGSRFLSVLPSFR